MAEGPRTGYERKKDKPLKNNRPKGLLSFLFYVTFDETVFEWFHNAPAEVPENFGLDNETRALIQTMGQRHEAGEDLQKEIVKQLMDKLGEEILREHYKEIW